MPARKRPTTELSPAAKEFARRQTAERLQAQAAQVEQGTIAVPLPWPKARPRYVVTVRLREEREQFRCVGFSVASLHPDNSVSSAVVRDFPVAQLVRTAEETVLGGRLLQAEAALAFGPAEMVSTHVDAEGSLVTEVVPVDEEFRRKRAAHWEAVRDEVQRRLGDASGEGKGRRYGAGHLEQVAKVVADARGNGEPVQAKVALVFGISRTAAANQIARARRQGLLETVEED